MSTLREQETPLSGRVPFRIGVDIGGTFTDVVVITDSGQAFVHKIATTAQDYNEAIVKALKQVLARGDLDGSAARDIVHGTTVATNAILERKGARTALITTKGFRDVLEIGRLRRPVLYDLNWEKPKPLVERDLRWEVSERLNAQGEVLVPLDPEEVRQLLSQLERHEIEALAVCLLHSYVNPVHEEQIWEIAKTVAPDLYLSISSQVMPQMMEAERTSTAVVNAYVGPVIKRYLHSMQRELATIGITAPVLLMQSSGAIMSIESAMERPVFMIESGPAAGVMAAVSVAGRRGDMDIISFDMGGTTAKASLIEGGDISHVYEYELGGGMSSGSRLLSGGGYTLRVPSVDISEIGAGGGSIVWLDKAGYPQVGPHSAGAHPGPVCYDMGGTDPTVTDCNVVLGYINPSSLLGGGLPLNRAKSVEAIEETVAKPSGLSTLDAAYGGCTLVVSNMTRAVKAVTTERGRDPRNLILYAFGGAGPLHAVELARALGIPRVVVPPSPGLFSAFGLLSAEVESHHVQSHICYTSDLTLEALDGLMTKLRNEAMGFLGRDGYSEDRVRFRYFADTRYRGQAHELTIPISGVSPNQSLIPALERDFSAEHERTYGFKVDGELVQVVNFRLAATGLRSDSPEPQSGTQGAIEARGSSADTQTPTSREAYFGSRFGLLRTPVVQRAELSATGQRGPVIIEEYDSTIVVPPNCSVALDEFGNVEIQVAA